MNFDDMSIEQLHAILDGLNADRLALRDRAKAARVALDRKMAQRDFEAARQSRGGKRLEALRVRAGVAAQDVSGKDS